ncbi:MAG: hypothetical protein ACYCXW_10300 [Solirubrobacteraceae bacterium]
MAAAVTVGCAGVTGQRCAVTVTLTVVETTSGPKIVAIRARRARLSRRTLVLGRERVVVGAGQRRKVTIRLDSVGKRLLIRLHRVRVALALAEGRRVTARRTLTFTLGHG